MGDLRRKGLPQDGIVDGGVVRVHGRRVVGVEVDEVEVEVLMGGLGLEGGDDEGVAAGVEGE